VTLCDSYCHHRRSVLRRGATRPSSSALAERSQRTQQSDKVLLLFIAH
jgi:hypothetical protein